MKKLSNVILIIAICILSVFLYISNNQIAIVNKEIKEMKTDIQKFNSLWKIQVDLNYRLYDIGASGLEENFSASWMQTPLKDVGVCFSKINDLMTVDSIAIVDAHLAPTTTKYQ
jgi:hypothetical protein